MTYQMQQVLEHAENKLRYGLYMYANNLNDGDTPDMSDYQRWLGDHIQRFKEEYGMYDYETLDRHSFNDEFDRYLIRCAELKRRGMN